MLDHPYAPRHPLSAPPTVNVMPTTERLTTPGQTVSALSGHGWCVTTNTEWRKRLLKNIQQARQADRQGPVSYLSYYKDLWYKLVILGVTLSLSLFSLLLIRRLLSATCPALAWPFQIRIRLRSQRHLPHPNGRRIHQEHPDRLDRVWRIPSQNWSRDPGRGDCGKHRIHHRVAICARGVSGPQDLCQHEEEDHQGQRGPTGKEEEEEEKVHKEQESKERMRND